MKVAKQTKNTIDRIYINTNNDRLIGATRLDCQRVEHAISIAYRRAKEKGKSQVVIVLRQNPRTIEYVHITIAQPLAS